MRKLQNILCFSRRNKILQCSHRWKKNLFDQPTKSSLRTYDNIFDNKVMITQLSVYKIISISKITTCITIDLSKQQKLDADPKAIQEINFTGNLEEDMQ